MIFNNENFIQGLCIQLGFAVYIKQLIYPVQCHMVICYGQSPTLVSQLLNADLHLLLDWVQNAKMQVNIKKSSVMWFPPNHVML